MLLLSLKGIIIAVEPAIFLDRDGVIIENRPTYVRHWSEVVIYPQALQALARIRLSPYKIVIITNQSAVGRGLMPLETAVMINQRLIAAIQQAGGRIDGVFMCPHAPEEECQCRKPKPGLLFQAAQALDLDLSRSIMIGDALSDLQAGQAAGLPLTVLVRSGRGRQQERLPLPAGLKPFLTYNTLAEALADLVQVDD
jgi:D-glycero-D-manno-heptose 1,7-bisphosphate phosphatase